MATMVPFRFVITPKLPSPLPQLTRRTAGTCTKCATFTACTETKIEAKPMAHPGHNPRNVSTSPLLKISGRNQRPFEQMNHCLQRRQFSNSLELRKINDAIDLGAFIRYAVSVQYHGGNHLGFSYQGPQGEDCLVYHRNSKGSNGNKNGGVEELKAVEADLRNMHSIEGRIRCALNLLVGSENYRNIQVSSRTDRGVHAWRNTFQVDVRGRLKPVKQKSLNDQKCKKFEQYSSETDDNFNAGNNETKEERRSLISAKNLVHGLNFYLARLCSWKRDSDNDTNNETNSSKSRHPSRKEMYKLTSSNSNHYQSIQRQNDANTIRILSAAKAPTAPSTWIPNMRYNPDLPEDEGNPKTFPWDVRFTATRRMYAYRVLYSFDSSSSLLPQYSLCSSNSPNSLLNLQSENEHEHGSEIDQVEDSEYYSLSSQFCARPFEHDRAWRIHDNFCKNNSHDRHKNQPQNKVIATNCDNDMPPIPLDTNAMISAAQYLIGTHDFSSFRGKGCQRSSPVVTLEKIWVGRERYQKGLGGFDGLGNVGEGLLSSVWKNQHHLTPSNNLHLITITIIGKSFLYHQVRNIVGCLVAVGQGKLKPEEVKIILEARDRSKAPPIAPPHGLFLVDVEHGDFQF